ncbi:hypothetical protein ACHHYP_15142 [Achlya hypogyna]|uniref:Transmembrane protein n=1 Tax=Achlya hypogyna TaxID=1202772 RepID=A0A1V9ZF02_ACHHY|nr:hypothetical protein ACHHYP_15142 [Achlya hypogyna]
MGLRSRQRRLAGITQEASLESFDQQVASTLEEHLAHSQNEVAAFNLLWKGFLGKLGYALLGFEILSLWLAVSTIGVGALAWVTMIKLLSCASIVCTKSYVTTGSFDGPALALSALHAILYGATSLGDVAPTTLRNTLPLSTVYYTGTALSVAFMGSNTKAEVARAAQLAKLDKLARSQ